LSKSTVVYFMTVPLYNRTMREYQSQTKDKISRFEAILIVAIIIMLAFFVHLGIEWYHIHLAHGNDNMKENTAESTARINSANGTDCVIQDCPGTMENPCPHYHDHVFTGYWDIKTETIVADKPDGYNEAKDMSIGDETWYGDIGTMVIEVTSDGKGNIQLKWVKGAQHESF
jgi:hypothetical protein